MKSNQNLHLLFWLKKSKATKDGSAPIYARITIDGTQEEIPLGKKALPIHWDVKNKMVTCPSPQTKLTNQRIVQVEADLNRYFTVLQTEYEHITALMLKNVYNGLPCDFRKGQIKEPLPAKTTIIGAFKSFIARFEKLVEKKKRSKETLKHWRTTKTKVEEFLEFEYEVKDMDVIDIVPNFSDKMYDYLTLEVDEPLAEITAKMHIKKTKQILELCVTNRDITVNPLKQFKCSGGEKDVEPLEYQQVLAIYKKDFGVDRLNEVRDAFVFQCFTGYAYQDVYALAPENIMPVGLHGERWLFKERGKTEVMEAVPILPIVDEIVARYSGHPKCKQKDRLLPIDSNTRYNGYLKEIQAICRIQFKKKDERLCTHRARHTFADIMLNNGVPLEDVSRMLGHRSIRTTQRYCRVRKQRISQNVGMVRDILFDKKGNFKHLPIAA